MNRSLWRGQAPINLRKSVTSNNALDIAIIGGGFSGLWSAYHLKQIQPSLKIAIFEWIIMSGALQAVYQNLRSALTQSIDEIGQIAQSNKWQIEYAKGGALVFATNEAQLTRISTEVNDEHNFLNQSQASELLNIAGIKGGIFTPHCAALNPFKLTQELARHLESLGVEIFENSKVEQITNKQILVNGYAIKCDTSIRATEAFTARKWIANQQIPIYSLMVATKP